MDSLCLSQQVVTVSQENQPKLLGASAFGSNEVYMKLKAFKSRLLEHSPEGKLCVCVHSNIRQPLRRFGRRPKLYFVKVDVQACFDTIEQSKLLEIIKDAISEVSDALTCVVMRAQTGS